jgi:serine/threonine-protein kinase
MKAHWSKCPYCKISTGNPSPKGPVYYSPGDQQEVISIRLPEIPTGEFLADRYRIKRKIGQGGSGTVYEVFDEFMQKPLALKFIPLESNEALQSIFLEYDTRKKIKNVDHILLGDQPFKILFDGEDLVAYPMELADKSFRDWLNETNEDLDERLEEGITLFREACLGVQALHEKELIHLDLKPENILLIKEKQGKKESWKVKITDFGLARGVGKMLGTIGTGKEGVGTPAYMAPEQILAAHWKDVSSSADIYALGMILFEILDGDLPYSGSSQQIRQKKLDEKLKIRRPSLDYGLANLAIKCIALLNEIRVGSINDIIIQISDWKKVQPDLKNADNTSGKNLIKDFDVTAFADLGLSIKWIEKLISQEDMALVREMQEIEKRMNSGS